MSQRTSWTLALLAATLATGPASAAWTPVDDASGETDPSRFIDPDTVRQAGPMAIYRQVRELTVYAARRESGLQSILRTTEYDCMAPRIRVLAEAAFASSDGSGAPVSLPISERLRGDWVALGEHPSGKTVWKLVCPGNADA